jgi:pilus assembly protein CpaB
MMNNKALSMSLLMAILAVFAVWMYVDGLEKQFKSRYGAEVPVLVATADIEELEPILPDMIEVTAVPKKYQAPGAKTSKESLLNSIAAGPIKKGEQITESRITYPSTRTGLSRQVTAGKRAIGIPVNDITGAGRLIKPGDRIDILASVKTGSDARQRQVKTIMQNVYVLAVGRHITNNVPITKRQRPGNDNPTLMKLNEYINYNTVQVEVDPNEAQKLVYYLSMDEPLYAILRNNDDRQTRPVPPITNRDIAADGNMRGPRGRRR